MMKFSATFITLSLLLIGSAVSSSAAKECYSCSGINCLRTSKAAIATCALPTDDCVTIFDGSEVVARGCFIEMPAELRQKCFTPDSAECNQCNENLCNNLGKKNHVCVQCDSRKDKNCKDDVSKVKPERCPASTSAKSYCYAKVIENNEVVRGCSDNSAAQNSCLADDNCLLCIASDMPHCNNYKNIGRGGESSTSPPISTTTPKDGGASSIASSLTMILFFVTALFALKAE